MSESSRSGSEPIELLILEQDFCTRVYSEAPCTASLAVGGRKCYNTLTTCQDTPNYQAAPLGLRFISNRVELPQDGNYYFPYLVSVRVNPGEINPGGGNESLSPLGKRTTMTATLTDHPHTDRIVDKYVDERPTGVAGDAFDPFTRSTFWSKWLARNLYWFGRRLTYISGYMLDGEIVDSITQTFFITDITRSSSGSVTISGADVLTKAQSRKAKAPFFSTGKLSADITAADTTFSISDDDGLYPSSGSIRIADEFMTYTKSAGGNFTVVRGQENTKAEDHKAGARVQLCLVYESQRPDDIIADLLTTYAGVPADVLDLTAWADEVDTFLPNLFGGIIGEPTSVAQLLGEISEAMSLYIWYDNRADKVKLRAVRPAADEVVKTLTDNNNLVKDSVQVSPLADRIITSVSVNYGIINPIKDLDDPNNYAANEVIFSGESVPERLDQTFTKVINSRWISSAQGAVAQSLGTRILQRFSTPPKQVDFALAAKDRDVWVGDFVTIKSRNNVDDVGLMRPLSIQVMRAVESKPGAVFSYSGQEFIFEEAPDTTTRDIQISGTLYNVDLRALHDSLFSGGLDGIETVTVTIRSGAKIGGWHSAGINADFINRDADIYTGNIRVPSDQNNVLTASLPTVTTDGSVTGWDVGESIPAGRAVILDTADDQTPGTYVPTTSEATAWSEARFVPTAVSLKTGSWPAGIKLRIVVEAGGVIAGHGANAQVHHGVLGGRRVHVLGVPGDALEITHPVEIVNQGLIIGGGLHRRGFFGRQVGTLMLFDKLLPADVGLILPGAAGGGVPGGLAVGNIKNRTVEEQVGAGASWFQVGERQPAGPGDAENVGQSGFFQPFFPVPTGVAGFVRYRQDERLPPGSDRIASAGKVAAAIFRSPSLFDPNGSFDTGALFGAEGDSGKIVRSGSELITWITGG